MASPGKSSFLKFYMNMFHHVPSPKSILLTKEIIPLFNESNLLRCLPFHPYKSFIYIFWTKCLYIWFSSYTNCVFDMIYYSSLFFCFILEDNLKWEICQGIVSTLFWGVLSWAVPYPELSFLYLVFQVQFIFYIQSTVTYLVQTFVSI
jgi:hypothetical protein